MKQLADLLAEADTRRAVVNDCVELIDAEVRSKKGFTGAAVKTAYKVVKAIKPGMIPESVNNLLDDFVVELQKFYGDYQQQGESGTLEAFLGARASDVAENLLTVTDRRAERAKSKTMVKAYKKLRPKGKEHVTIAVPGVGRVLDKHVAKLAS